MIVQISSTMRASGGRGVREWNQENKTISPQTRTIILHAALPLLVRNTYVFLVWRTRRDEQACPKEQELAQERAVKDAYHA